MLYTLTQDLEVPYLIAEVLHDSSLVFEQAGEYDLAISSHLESIKILGGGDTPYMALSRIYATIGNGQKALEWIEQAFDYVQHLEFPQLYIRKAWALALLKRLKDAESNLDAAHSLILKTGQDAQLGRYYHISGVLELARGNHQEAKDFLKQSYEIMSRWTMSTYLNVTLLDLARVEILHDQATLDAKTAVPGKWLSKLEQYATEHELVGIRMYAALLKADFYQKHSQHRDAYATLQEALNITDSPGVNTLRRMITIRMKEIEHQLQDDEIAS
jgi:tetratricopeptide (TPR) repeat protein